MMSVLCPKANVRRCDWNIRQGPEADVGGSAAWLPCQPNGATSSFILDSGHSAVDQWCPLFHSRQWVGETSTRWSVSERIHPPTTRRHGNTRACGLPLSMTASSSSTLNGAVDMGFHTRSLYSVQPARPLI